MQIITHDKTAQVLHIKVNVRTKEFENRTKFQKHFHSMCKSYTQRIVPKKC